VFPGREKARSQIIAALLSTAIMAKMAWNTPKKQYSLEISMSYARTGSISNAVSA